ncbi:hypothetical protein [Kamptonema formosum]|uniref:hypothetical protein n=1 Tax=Kamptonema formosum TaxID=331992 RepID=UPI0012DC8E16|nr:hypothetical protein [Oscillatoria sp. PCC 10802]
MRQSFARLSLLVLSGALAVVAVAPSQAAGTAQMNSAQPQQQGQEPLRQPVLLSLSKGSSSCSSSSTPSSSSIL